MPSFLQTAHLPWVCPDLPLHKPTTRNSITSSAHFLGVSHHRLCALSLSLHLKQFFKLLFGQFEAIGSFVALDRSVGAQ